MKTLINGEVLHLTEHAVQRYVERIKNVYDATYQEQRRYAEDLRRLIECHGSLSDGEPSWIGIPPEDTTTVRRATAYVSIGDSICIPVERGSNGWIGLTLLARGGFSSERRANRNRRKQEQRQRRSARRLNESWRGEGSPRWN